MATYNINHSGDAIYNIDNKQNNIAADQSIPKEPRLIACASTTISIEVEKLTEYYIPRNDEALTKLLQDVPTRCPKVVVLHGEKGTGKTSCCRGFARSVRDHPNKPFTFSRWIGANSVSVFKTDLLAGFPELGISVDEEPAWKKTVNDCLGQLQQPWLLILDDACERVLKQLKDILPENGSGLVLINTNVLPECVVPQPDWVCLPCRNMTQEQAVRLLRDITGDRSSDESVYKDIAKCCSYLPFALDKAGACIKNTKPDGESFAPEVYLESFESVRSEVLAYKDPGNDSRCSAAMVIEASLRQVQAELDDACATTTLSVHSVLQLLSFFLSENLPLDIMPFNDLTFDTSDMSPDEKRDWMDQHVNWTQRHVEAIVGCSPCSSWSSFSWRVLKGLLRKYHLLNNKQCGSTTIYSMHSLVLGWANDTIRHHPNLYSQLELTATTILASARYFRARTQPEQTVLLSRLYPHWQACRHATCGSERCSVDDFSPMFLKKLTVSNTPQSLAYQDLLFEEIEIFKARGRTREAIGPCQSLLNTRIQQTDEEAKQRSRTQLGECREALGNHKGALIVREAVLENAKRQKPGEALLPAVLDVAKSRTKLGDYEKAYELLKGAPQTIVGLRKVHHRDDIMLIKKRLGNVCQRTGRFEEAIQNREEVLHTLNQRCYPRDHAEVLDAKTNLAHSYLEGSTIQRKCAHILYREVVDTETSHHLLPDDHPRVLVAWDNLAWSLLSVDDQASLDEARQILVKVLKLRLKYSDNHDVWAIKVRIKLAICDVRAGKFDHACTKLWDCLQSPTLRTGMEDETRFWAMQELVDALLQDERTTLPRYEGLAIQIYLYETYLKQFSYDNPNMIKCAKRIAISLEHLGCWQAALPYRTHVVSCFRTVRDALDEERLRAERHLARNLSESPHKNHQDHAGKLFDEVVTNATKRHALDLPTHTSFAFYVMPYIDHLKAHELFDEGCLVVEKVFKSPKLLDICSEEDKEDLKYQLEDCCERVAEPQDSWFALYQENQALHPIISELEHRTSGFPILPVSAYVKAVFDWERRARTTEMSYPILLPSRPPWDPCPADAELIDNVITKRNSLMTVLSRTEIHTRPDTPRPESQKLQNKRKRFMFRRAKGDIRSVIACLISKMRKLCER